MDFHRAGGVPQVLTMLLKAGLPHGECLTITGRSMAEELKAIARIVRRSGGSAAGEIVLEVQTAAGETAASAVAGLPCGAAPIAPDLGEYPEALRPSTWVPPEPGALAALGPLGSLVLELDADVVGSYAAEAADDHPLYRISDGRISAGQGHDAVAHPGLLLQQANRLLSENVALGSWVHVESDLAHLGVPGPGIG